MGRTRSTAVDGGFENNGVLWETHDNLRYTDPFNNDIPVEEDYTDLGFLLFVPGALAANQNGFAEATVWGIGLISLGPVTQAQINFLANPNNYSNLSAFPGEYFSTNSFGTQSQFDIEVGTGMADFRENPFQDSSTIPAFSTSDVELYQTAFSMQFQRASVFISGGARIGGRQFAGGSAINFGEFFKVTGTSADNNLIGTAMPNVMLGGDGNDQIQAGAGSDTVQGGIGDDNLFGDSGSDTLSGEVGRDRLFGGAGSDILNGGDGDDYLDGGTEHDVIDGGTGIDTLYLRNPLAAGSANGTFGGNLLVSDLRASNAYWSRDGVKQFSAVEAFELVGTSGRNKLVGGVESDTLRGDGGNDWLIGGAGNDTLSGDASGPADYQSPEPVQVNLDLIPTLGVNRTNLDLDLSFRTSADADIVNATTVPHTTIAGTFRQEVQVFHFTAALGAIVTLDVDEANFSSVVRLKLGNAILAQSSSTPDGVDPTGDPSEAFLSFTTTVAGRYSIELGKAFFEGDFSPLFDDSYKLRVSVTQASLLQGNRLEGGLGDDTYMVSAASDEILERSGEGIDTVRTAVSYTLASGTSVEQLYTQAAGATAALNLTGNEIANTIVGNAGANTLLGLGGNDYLIGGAGNDILNGGIGANTLQGGLGDDVYQVENAGDSTFEFANEGVDEVRTALSVYALQNNIENLTFTNNASHGAGVGNALNNVIRGGTGRDELFGREGSDTLFDGGGAAGSEDALLGGLGDDIYMVGVRGSSTVELANEGLDEVRTALAIYELQNNVELLTLTDNATHLAAVGNALANVIIGGTGRDDLFGRAGDDTLQGGSGAANTMLGQEGNDIYVVGAAGDSVIESANQGIDTVLTGLSSYAMTNHVEQLRYTGSGDFTGVGNDLANSLVGGAGADFLSGRASDDVLLGGNGSDQLFGGDGPDQFRYNGGETGLDRIFDFAPGSDKLLLSAAGFSRTATLAYVRGTTASSTNSSFLYNPETGIVSYDRDGSGSAQAVQLAQLNAGLTPSLADFGFFGGPSQVAASDVSLADAAIVRPFQIIDHWAVV